MGEAAEQYIWALCPCFTFMQIQKCLIIWVTMAGKKNYNYLTMWLDLIEILCNGTYYIPLQQMNETIFV